MFHVGRVCSVSLAVYLPAFIIFLVAFALPHWVSKSDTGSSAEHYGIWQECRLFDEWRCRGIDPGTTETWFKASQGFMIVAVILGFVAGTIYARVPVNAAFQIIAGVSSICSAAIFAAKVRLEESEKLDWAFYLAIVSGVLFLFNGILLATIIGKDGCTTREVKPSNKTMKKKLMTQF